MEEKRKHAAVCPITFINGDVHKEKFINNCIISPFNAKLSEDIFNSGIIHENWGENNKNFNSIIQNKNVNTIVESIKSYMAVNITDIIRNVIISWVEDVFSCKDFKSSSDFVGHILCRSEIYNNINTIVDEIISRRNLFSFVCNNDNIPAQNIIYLNLVMSEIYSEVYQKIFDPFVIELTNDNLYNGDLFEELYGILYNKVFNYDPSENKRTPTVQNKYSFCNSVLREYLESYMLIFNDGLIGIAFTCAQMLSIDYTISPMYNANLLDNPDFDPMNIIHNDIVSDYISYQEDVAPRLGCGRENEED